jgi:hypothetical protein
MGGASSIPLNIGGPLAVCSTPLPPRFRRFEVMSPVLSLSGLLIPSGPSAFQLLYQVAYGHLSGPEDLLMGHVSLGW